MSKSTNVSPYSNMLLVTRERNINDALVFYYALDQSPEAFRKLGLHHGGADTTMVCSNFKQLTSGQTKLENIYKFPMPTRSLRPATPEDLSSHYQRLLGQIDSILQDITTLLLYPPNICNPQ